MKQILLREKHLELKAKMTEFQGCQVPLQYSDAVEEYHAVRTGAGLFDVSFLGRIEIAGAEAPSFLQNIFTWNIDKISEGSAHYGFICNESGFILDDPLLFRLHDKQKDNKFLLTTNAANTEKILAWLREHASDEIEIADLTETTGQLALQGPQSPLVIEKLLGPHFKKIKPRMSREISVLDTTILVSRTGYTGEYGFEFFIPASRTEAFWNALMSAGNEFGIKPCGLGSRDVLRIEMGYLLYGSDIDETCTPIEAGCGSLVDLKKNFIGKEALAAIKAAGTKQKLAGFSLLDKGVPRAGGCIFSENREIGTVTSGCHSPHVRAGIGLGYVVTRYAQAGQEIEIELRDRELAAKVVDLPFYRKK